MSRVSQFWTGYLVSPSSVFVLTQVILKFIYSQNSITVSYGMSLNFIYFISNLSFSVKMVRFLARFQPILKKSKSKPKLINKFEKNIFGFS